MARKQQAFPGFPPETASFLQGIEENNNREWFEANKTLYLDSVKKPMENLIEALGREMVDYAPDYITEPKKAVFRIYRDVRFAKDKKPYKTNIAAGMSRRNLNKNDSASFYLHLERQQLMIAAGIYMPAADTLKLLRQSIAKNHDELRKILADKKLIRWMGGLQGQPLTRAPKGYLPGDPAEDLLRHKMYVVWVELDPALAYGPKLVKEVSERLRAATPLVEFLNRPLLERTKAAQFFL